MIGVVMVVLFLVGCAEQSSTAIYEFRLPDGLSRFEVSQKIGDRLRIEKEFQELSTVVFDSETPDKTFYCTFNGVDSVELLEQYLMSISIYDSKSSSVSVGKLFVRRVE